MNKIIDELTRRISDNFEMKNYFENFNVHVETNEMKKQAKENVSNNEKKLLKLWTVKINDDCQILNNFIH